MAPLARPRRVAGPRVARRDLPRDSGRRAHRAGAGVRGRMDADDRGDDAADDAAVAGALPSRHRRAARRRRVDRGAGGGIRACLAGIRRRRLWARRRRARGGGELAAGWSLHGWVVGAAVIGVAGAFQFSALKYRCLERCRTPFGFINSRWRGRRPLAESFRLGLDHGLFCVGCCWALMLVTFVVGMGNIGWMLVLAAAMAAEKNLSWGARLRTPLGLALLGWAAAIAVANG